MLETAELLLALALPWRLWRIVLLGAFVRSFPRLALRYAFAALAYSLFVLLVALHVPRGLPVLAALAVAGLLADAWRAREGYGRRARLPPGSIAPLVPRRFTDQDFYRTEARRLGPVFKSAWFTRPSVCVVGLERGLDLIQRAGDALGPTRYSFSRFVPGGFLRTMPAAPHQKYRKILQEVFVRETIEACAGDLASCFRAALQSAAAACAGEPGGGVRVRLVVNRALFAAWGRLFFGLEPGSPVALRMKALYREIDIRNPSFLPDRRVAQAMRELLALASAEQERLGAGGSADSFLARLAALPRESAEDPVVLGNVVMVAHTSWSDVAGLAQWLVKELSDHPEWAARLRQAGEPGPDPGPDSLAERVVLETLRLEQSELLHRNVLRELEVDGFVIPRGWLLRVCVGESHRLADVFERPDDFDPDRFRGRAFTAREYAPFGTAPYSCLGSRLVVTAGRILVAELARGFDWRVVDDGKPEFGPWCHWRPSSRFRIAITPTSRLTIPST